MKKVRHMQHGIPRHYDWTEIEALTEPVPFNQLPSQEALFMLYIPNFEKGILYHRWSRGGAGYKNEVGYDHPAMGVYTFIYRRTVRVRDILYKMYNDVESRRIIHLNGDVHDNRIGNLAPIETVVQEAMEVHGITPKRDLPSVEDLHESYQPQYDTGTIYHHKELQPMTEDDDRYGMC